MAALADPQATTVIYMGKRTFPALVAMLTEAGLSPETPALLAEAVGHPHQSLHHSTIGAAHIEDAEVHYLCEQASRYFERPVQPADVV